MSQMADDQGPTSAGIDVALKSAPAPKQSVPPKILPKVDLPYDHTLVTDKELQGDIQSRLNVQANVRSPGALQSTNPEMASAEQNEAANTFVIHGIRNAALKNINPEVVFHRVMYLLSLEAYQHQPPRKDLSSKYTQKVEDFIAKLQVSSLDEILSEEMDAVFLRQLLEDTLDILEMETVTMPATRDPVLEFLEAAPSCYLRENAEQFAPILDIP